MKYFYYIIIFIYMCISCREPKKEDFKKAQPVIKLTEKVQFKDTSKNSKSNTSALENQLKKIVDSISNKKYFLVKQQNCDLNKDNLIDEILVFDYIEDTNPNESSNRKSPIVILINRSIKYEKIINYNIFPNSYDDSFHQLIIKNNFFTIELEKTIPDNSNTRKYITFKYDNNLKKIILHKYGENVELLKESKINETVYNHSEFGIIEFKNYDSNTIWDIVK